MAAGRLSRMATAGRCPSGAGTAEAAEVHDRQVTVGHHLVAAAVARVVAAREVVHPLDLASAQPSVSVATMWSRSTSMCWAMRWVTCSVMRDSPTLRS